MAKSLFILITCLILSLFCCAQEQSLSWAVQTEGTGNAWAESIETDGEGNVFTAGYFIGDEAFDAGTATLNSGSGHAGLISKHSSSGELIWTIALAGSQEVRIRCMEVDTEGNLYVGGTFQGVLDFDPSSEIEELASPNVSTGFIAKYANSGELIWSKKLESESGASTIYAMALDEHGAILATGRYENTVDFNPNEGEDLHTAFSQTDAFILKWNIDGEHLWVKSIGGWYQDEAYAIQLDDSDNIFCAGYFSTSMDANPGIGSSMLYSAGGMDIFFMKLDSEGQLLWAKQIEGSDNDRLYSMNLQGHNELYLTGYFKGSADFDPGEPNFQLDAVVESKDAFIAKYDGNGTFRWAKSLGGVFDDLGNSMVVDETGVLLAGQYWGEVDLDPGTGVSMFSSEEVMDVYLLKLNNEGDFQWAQSIGGTATDYYPHLTLDPLGNLLMASSFSGNCDADPSEEDYIMNASGYDILIQKFEDVPLGLEDLDSPVIIRAYPSPTSGDLTLDLSGFRGAKTIQIFTSNGRLVYDSASPVGEKMRNIHLNGSAGLYFIQVMEVNGQSTTVRVIKR